jgi:quinol monooxygenase YgiN
MTLRLSAGLFPERIAVTRAFKHSLRLSTAGPMIAAAVAVAGLLGGGAAFAEAAHAHRATTVALLVELKAKPGKEQQVADFLASARPLAVKEPGTVTWYAGRIDAQTFVIFDTFRTQSGREAHLKGPIAAALMAHAGELFAVPPHIQQVSILADK